MKKSRPQRICSQRWNEVTCVLCTFNNLFQKQIFKNLAELVRNYQTVCKYHRIDIPSKIQDDHGVIEDVILEFFKNHNYEVDKVKKNDPVEWGWATFKVKLHGHEFLHMVAIVHGYVIDSIRLDSIPEGIYFWKGKLVGYDSQKLKTLYRINAI